MVVACMPVTIDTTVVSSCYAMGTAATIAAVGSTITAECFVEPTCGRGSRGMATAVAGVVRVGRVR